MKLKLIIILLALLIIFSCQSTDKTGDALSRTTSSIRLDDISKELQENPVAALNLIYFYKEAYLGTDDSEDWKKLSQYEEEAVKNLFALQEKAIEEERWDDALSF